jgi:hypothetical protein
MAPDNMPNSTTEVALLAVAVTCGSLAFGYLLASTIVESLVDDRWLLWALAFPGLIVFSVVLTVVHAVSGGELYSRPIAVWILTAATVVVLIIVRHRKRRSRPKPTRADLVAVLTGVVAIAVWALPALGVIPLVVGGDHFHHMAWTNQLLNGEPLPTGALTGTLPNDYPWGFHGLTALLTAFMPTKNPYLTLHPLQLLLPFGGALGFLALGTRAFRDINAGVAAAILGAASGGFGFLLRFRTGIVTHPRNPRQIEAFIGDYLQRRSYNLSFGNISPPFPRDVTYVLLPVFLWLLLSGIEGRRRALVAAGVTLGVCGLMGGDVYIIGIVVGACAVLLAPGHRARWLSLVSFLVPALAVWALWLVPMAIHYVRLGGFRDLSSPPVNLPVDGVIGGWGLALPLGLVGLWAGRRSVKRPGMVLALCLLVVPLIVIVFPATLVSNKGFATLLRDHRYWPMVHAGLALLGGLGASFLLSALKRRDLQVAAALLLFVIAVSSPIAGSIGSVDHRRRGSELIREAMIGGPRVLFNLIRGPTGTQRNIAVPHEMEEYAYSYTGYRLVHYFPNRLRFPGIYESIPTRRSRKAAWRVLMNPRSPDAWLATAQEFDLDLLVIPTSLVGNPNLPSCEVLRPSSPEGLTVIFTRTCSGLPDR